ncbi:dihydrofolate reductase family protein [Rugosimonospora acidiphila]|uniref:Dihydrofolate reductase family protein n=1 Tax=Rugosimonospora acidiphila TaxID=556531 RepID=A0ABP9RLH9_9ACTN
MKLTVQTFLTLDGVMQSPGKPEEDPRGGFTHGGWQFPLVDDDTVRIITGAMANADALLLGRTTYEIFAGHWPHVTDEGDAIAARLNAMPKYVVSTTLNSLGWHNSTLIRDNLAGGIAELKAQPGNEVQVHGSGKLAASLLAYDLVDEYRLWIHPVVLGSGQRLFTDAKPLGLRLTDVTTTGGGVIVASYRPTGAPRYGSF